MEKEVEKLIEALRPWCQIEIDSVVDPDAGLVYKARATARDEAASEEDSFPAAAVLRAALPMIYVVEHARRRGLPEPIDTHPA